MANIFSKHETLLQKRETMIVFVYDTECCKEEADDPVDAVLYFHPSWVSDVQKLSLCGQLMGTTHFLTETFGKPKIISLQSGKFVLSEFGRFILATGTDRNLSDSLLQHRAELLTSLLKFFHRDIQTIHDQFSTSGQYKNLSDKLYHIFETYLPILQYNGNVFQNVPTLRLPKSAGIIFMEAIQTLQSCQSYKGVLGGVILYHNKSVATQLSENLTKHLVLTDPHRIKSTAEPIVVDFHVPNGVQMMIVYIPSSEYQQLLFESQRAQSFGTQNSSSNTAVPFQFQKRKIKRDKSLIFTNIPEEATCDQAPAVSQDVPTTSKAANRPNHLPLRFKNVPTKDIPESGFASINFDETDSYPEFIGRTSVCSTPMTENKILSSDIMSIVANTGEIDSKSGEKSDTKSSSPEKKSSFNFDFEKFISNFVSNPQKEERRNSFADLQDSLKKISKRLSLRPFGIGLPKVETNKSDSATPDYVDDIDNRKTYKTITDPTCPVFSSTGEPISKSLFEEFAVKHYSSRSDDKQSEETIRKMFEEFKEFNGSRVDESPQNNLPSTSTSTSGTTEKDEITKNPPQKSMQNRKALTLPLKPLNESNEKDQISSSSNIFERKKLSGIQLTPLMAKLSVLAQNEERSSGFCSWDTTPGMELPTPIDTVKSFRRKSSIRAEDIPTSVEDDLQKVELYICGQQNMTLLLLLEEGSSQREELVKEMFDICVSRFNRLETTLTKILNVHVEGEKSEGGYSFISLDTMWDIQHRGGPWSPSDLLLCEYMHKDLNNDRPLTDMLVRTDDSVIFAYKLGRNEVFYKQAANPQSGLPPPADTMGTIAMRAKKRLERDHSIILL